MTATRTAVRVPAWRLHRAQPAAGIDRVEWAIEETVRLAAEVDEADAYGLLAAFMPAADFEIRCHVEVLLDLADEVADCEMLQGHGPRSAAVDDYCDELRVIANLIRPTR